MRTRGAGHSQEEISLPAVLRDAGQSIRPWSFAKPPVLVLQGAATKAPRLLIPDARGRR